MNKDQMNAIRFRWGTNSYNSNNLTYDSGFSSFNKAESNNSVMHYPIISTTRVYSVINHLFLLFPIIEIDYMSTAQKARILKPCSLKQVFLYLVRDNDSKSYAPL